LGRGACGFITRGDIGPAKMGETPFGAGAMPVAGPPGLTAPAAAPPGLSVPNNPEAGKAQAAQAKGEDYSDANFDDWNGYSGALFAGLKEDAEDREADQSFAKVEDYIDGRRRKKRDEKARELSLKYT